MMHKHRYKHSGSRGRRVIRYKGVKVNSIGFPVDHSEVSRSKDDTKKTKRVYHPSFESSFEKTSPKNLIVIYDISEEFKKERDWFRRQLINFDFIMVQRSVWVGPSPLPTDFLAYIKKIGINGKFKTFKLAKAYDENKNNL